MKFRLGNTVDPTGIAVDVWHWAEILDYEEISYKSTSSLLILKELIMDMYQWSTECFGNPGYYTWYLEHGRFYFSNETDRLAFIMRWNDANL